MKIITVVVLLFLCVGFINARAVPSEQQTPKAESDNSESHEQQTETDSPQAQQQQSPIAETNNPQTQDEQAPKAEANEPETNDNDQGSSPVDNDNQQSQEQEASATEADNSEAQEQGSSVTETDNPVPQEQEADGDNPERQDENVASAAEDDNNDGSGSAMENMDDELSGGSGSADLEYNDSPVQLPKPYHFPFMGFKGPVTITPMEPNINRQKPYKYNRPCFFCFPRGRLGRVEVTAPGGPFLMNNYGLVGYGMGYPGMGMAPPNMGFPEYGPYPVGPLGEQLPSHGNHGNFQEEDNNFGGNDMDSNGPEEGPMEFTDISEEPVHSHPKPAGKAMGHPGPKIMDHSKGAHVAAPVAPVKVPVMKPAVPATSPVPIKPVSDELAMKAAAQSQPSAQPMQVQPQVAAPQAAAVVQTPAQGEQPAVAAPVPSTTNNNVQPQQTAAQPAV